MVSEHNAAEYGWQDFRNALRRRWRAVLLFGSVFLLGGGLLNWQRPIVHEAEATLAIEARDSGAVGPRAITEMRPATLNEIRRAEAALRSSTLFLEVARDCDLEKKWGMTDRVAIVSPLKKRTRVIREDHSNLLNLAARDESPELAAALVNSLARNYSEKEESRWRSLAEEHVRKLEGELRNREEEVEQIEKRLHVIAAESETDSSASEANDLRRELIGLQHVIRSLEAKHQLSIVELQKVNSGVTVVREASAPDARALDYRRANMALFGLLGLAMGAVIVGLLSLREAPNQMVERVAKEFDAKIVHYTPIATTPLKPGSAYPESMIESYRELRLRVHRLPAGECTTLTLLADDDDSGIGFVAPRLAGVLADAGHTVLLIDGDMREPSLHEPFGAARHPGLSDFLSGEMRMEETVIRTRVNNLWLIPSGPRPTDPATLLSSKRTADLLWEMKSRFDYIIITAPSLTRYADACELVERTDHTLLVSSCRNCSVGRLQKSRQELEFLGASVSGVLLTHPIPGEPTPKKMPTKKADSPKSKKTAPPAKASPKPSTELTEAEPGSIPPSAPPPLPKEESQKQSLPPEMQAATRGHHTPEIAGARDEVSRKAKVEKSRKSEAATEVAGGHDEPPETETVSPDPGVSIATLGRQLNFRIQPHAGQNWTVRQVFPIPPPGATIPGSPRSGVGSCAERSR